LGRVYGDFNGSPHDAGAANSLRAAGFSAFAKSARSQEQLYFLPDFYLCECNSKARVTAELVVII
jgi:hypothetical protein